MTSDRLTEALELAARGWPVFPCQPGQKIPATTHGYRDASTDPGQITYWFTRNPRSNLAIATGAPGPDVLDVDQHHPAGDGFAALIRLRDARLPRAWRNPAYRRARRQLPAPAEPARASGPFIGDPVPAGLIPGEGTGLPWSLT